MTNAIGTENAPAPGEESKIDILKNAVRAVMASNAGKVNMGIGSLYGTSPSGVQWPITDLTADANTTDPSIPVGTKTNADVISEQLDSKDARGFTATVDALSEAADYFSGAQVYHNGDSLEDVTGHIPDIYDPINNRYDDGHHQAAIPASYTPVNAYIETGGDGSSYGFCNDFTINGTVAGEINYCAGLAPYDCEERTHTSGSDEIASATTTSQPKLYCKYPRDDQFFGATYVSPITSECQVNAIILISDGDPTSQRNEEITEKHIGHDTDLCDDMTSIYGNGTDEDTVNMRESAMCGPELAKALATNQQLPSIGDSYVKTFTVGFDVVGPGHHHLNHYQSR